MNEKLDVGLHFTLLFCAIVGYLPNQKHASRFLRLALLYLFVTAAFDGFAAVIMLTDFLSSVVSANLFLYHFLTPLQYTIVILMYRSVIKNKNVKRWMLWSIPVFWIIAVFFTMFAQPLHEYPTYTMLTNYILIIPVILYFLIEVLNAPNDYELTREPAFWIGTGLLLYSVGNVFAQGISNKLIPKKTGPLFDILYTASSILNYVLFLCFIVAFLRNPKQHLSERSIRSY